MKRIKGSLTVEAALVLPVFMIAILTIAFITQLYFTYESMDYSMTQAAHTIAEKGYLYRTSGLLDAQHTVDDAAEASGVVQTVNTMKEDINHAQKIIGSNDLSSTFTNTKQSVEQIIHYESIDDLLLGISNMKSSVESDVEPILKSVDEFVRGFNALISNKSGLLSTGTSIGVDKLKTLVLGAYVKQYVEGSQENAGNLFIVDGDIDYSQSRFFYTLNNDALQMSEKDVITITATYMVKLPLAFQVIGEIPVVNTVTIRGWTGEGVMKKAIKPISDKVEDQKEEILVYHTTVSHSDVYHAAGCKSLFKTIAEITISDASGMEVCDICSQRAKKENIAIESYSDVFITSDGEKYHYYSNCSSISRQFEELTLQQATESNYRPCSICKPPTDY